MILRRVIEHVKAQNWTAVGLDFVIVVVGVYLGIQVNNWDQSRADRRTETAYLELLQSDLRSAKSDIEWQIKFEGFQVELANAAFRLIAQEPSEMRLQKLGIIFTKLGARRTLKIDSPTFQDMQSSGKLELISDPVLRNEIVSYFFRIHRWEVIIEKNNEYFIDRSYGDYVDDINVGYWVWDEDLMGVDAGVGVDNYGGLIRERVDEALLKSGGGVLMSPPDAEMWDAAKSRLSSRASISVTNESFARNLLEATEQIEEKIAAHLEVKK